MDLWTEKAAEGYPLHDGHILGHLLEVLSWVLCPLCLDCNLYLLHHHIPTFEISGHLVKDQSYVLTCNLQGFEYPPAAQYGGWILTGFAVLQIPVWFIRALFVEKSVFKPNQDWGPAKPLDKIGWIQSQEQTTEL